MEQTSTIARKLSIKIFEENRKTHKTSVIFRYVIISEQQNI